MPNLRLICAVSFKAFLINIGHPKIFLNVHDSFMVYEQLEKLELTEHCDRMLAALWSFKAELTDSKSPNRVDEDTNAKFAKLMAKLEELSIRLAERDIDYKLLSGTEDPCRIYT